MPGKRMNRRGKLQPLLPAVAVLSPFLKVAGVCAEETYSADWERDTDAILDGLAERILVYQQVLAEPRAHWDHGEALRGPPEVDNLDYARTPMTADNVETGSQSAANRALIAGLVACAVVVVTLWAMARYANYHQRESQHASEIHVLKQRLENEAAKGQRALQALQALQAVQPGVTSNTAYSPK